MAYLMSLFLAVALAAGSTFAAAETAPRVDDPQIEAGRVIYEQGILPDGTPLRALRPEGFVLEGPHAACVTCHRRSGMGSIEGSLEKTILVPPVAGPLLFVPARFHGTYLNAAHHYVPNASWHRALTRPAYDEASLGRSLREGVDPGGEALVAPMPRYDLDAAALSALTAYMRQLTSQVAPGVGAEVLHLATIVTPDAPAGHVRSVLGVVRAWSGASQASGSPWRLHVWKLTGPAQGWEAQLQDFYRRQPVFAVLSGAGGVQWTPVHRFCEHNRVACVFPSVEAEPQREDGDFYSVYFSPGVSLEARLLARHLGSSTGTRQPGAKVVQVFSDASGRRAAETLATELERADRSSDQRRFRPTAPAAVLEALVDRDILVLWLRPSELAQLVAVLPDGPAPRLVVLSSLLAPPEATPLPPAWKARVSYVSLFDDLGLQGEIARLRLERWLERAGLADDGSRRLQADAYAACYLFSQALGEIRNQEVRRPEITLSREHLLETLETLVNKYSDGTRLVDPDSHVAHYGRMSLGPRQRFAVRGGILLRYATPASDKLVPASGRIVP